MYDRQKYHHSFIFRGKNQTIKYIEYYAILILQNENFLFLFR